MVAIAIDRRQAGSCSQLGNPLTVRTKHSVRRHQEPFGPPSRKGRKGVVELRGGAPARDVSAGPDEVVAALQLLLQVEYLQSALYASTVAATGLVPATDAPVFDTLASNTAQPLSLITEAISTRATLPAPSPAFDFTVKGAFPGFAFAAV